MKLNNVLVISFLFLGSTLAGGFKASCKTGETVWPKSDWIVETNGFWIKVPCKKINGAYVDAHIDLTRCIGNSGGNLVHPGNLFHKTCVEYGRSIDNFSARCQKAGVLQSTKSYIDLDTVLTNYDGMVAC